MQNTKKIEFPFVNTIFDEILNNEVFGINKFNVTKSLPLVNVKEEEDKYILELAASGLKKSDFNIEIGGGLGPFAGKVWRIGLMGYSAHEDNVDKLLKSLKTLL